MYDAQFEMIASRIDEIEAALAYLHDSARGDSALAHELEAELATPEHRLENIELLASYEPDFAEAEE